MNIRKATESDARAVTAIIIPIIREGTTYTLDPAMSEAEALAYWIGVVLGTYYMRPNQAGGGQHVCNCGYMTDAAATGRGIARAPHVRTFVGICALSWLPSNAVQLCGQHE